MALSFIGGGSWRKPLTCHKSLTNFITTGKITKNNKNCIKEKNCTDKKFRCVISKSWFKLGSFMP
jgi:hypothetical protein